MACTATHDGVPCDAALHGDKDARDHENERDASFLICLAIEMVANCAAMPARRRTRRSHGAQPLGQHSMICCNGLLQMIVNFLDGRAAPAQNSAPPRASPDTGNHAGVRRVRAPARRPPMAC